VRSAERRVLPPKLRNAVIASMHMLELLFAEPQRLSTGRMEMRLSACLGLVLSRLTRSRPPPGLSFRCQRKNCNAGYPRVTVSLTAIKSEAGLRLPMSVPVRFGRFRFRGYRMQRRGRPVPTLVAHLSRRGAR
jgi:hypothetical protein